MEKDHSYRCRLLLSETPNAAGIENPCEKKLQIVQNSSLNPGDQSKPFENKPWAMFSGKTLLFQSCGGDVENDLGEHNPSSSPVINRRRVNKINIVFRARNKLIEIHNVS